LTESRAPRQRLALIDVSLADCDCLDRRLGGRLEVALVVVAAEDEPVARWAEVGGYPRTADLRRLSAVVADLVAIGADSPRRDDALALASLAGMRAVVLAQDSAPAAPAAAGATDRPAPAAGAVLRLEDAFEQLFGPLESAEP
jgi:hypothetical protein